MANTAQRLQTLERIWPAKLRCVNCRDRNHIAVIFADDPADAASAVDAATAPCPTCAWEPSLAIVRTYQIDTDVFGDTATAGRIA